MIFFIGARVGMRVDRADANLSDWILPGKPLHAVDDAPDDGLRTFKEGDVGMGRQHAAVPV
jgi:hypothetical protein